LTTRYESFTALEIIKSTITPEISLKKRKGYFKRITIFVKKEIMLLFISGPEIFVVLLLVVMLFGADKIPEIARGLGKGMRQIKDATNDIKKEINESAEKNDLNLDVTKDIQKEIDDVKENIEKATGPIKRMR
jgi:sec-independent protein translocase protein TatA